MYLRQSFKIRSGDLTYTERFRSSLIALISIFLLPIFTVSRFDMIILQRGEVEALVYDSQDSAWRCMGGKGVYARLEEMDRRL